MPRLDSSLVSTHLCPDRVLLHISSISSLDRWASRMLREKTSYLQQAEASHIRPTMAHTVQTADLCAHAISAAASSHDDAQGVDVDLLVVWARTHDLGGAVDAGARIACMQQSHGSPQEGTAIMKRPNKSGARLECCTDTRTATQT